MPTVPVYDRQLVERGPLPGPRMPMNQGTSFFGELGKGLGEISKQFNLDSAAYNRAQATLLVGKTKEEFENIIQKNALEQTDPDEFLSTTTDALKTYRDSTIAAQTNAEIRAQLQANLEPDLMRATRKVQSLTFAKRHDGAKAAVEESRHTYGRLAINAPNEEERTDALAAYGNMVGYMRGTNLLSAEQAGEYLRGFKEHVRTGRKELFSTGLKDQLQTMINNATTGKEPPSELFLSGTKLIESFKDLEPAEVEKKKLEFKDALWTGAIEGRIDRDPFTVDKELHSGAWNSLVDQQSLRFLKNKSETAIDRIARNLEAQRKESERLIGKQVDDFKGAVMSGFSWSGNVAQLAAKVKGTEHEKEFVETVRDSHELSLFGQMGPLKQEEYLRAKAQDAKSGSEASLYRKLETAHEKTKSALKDDPLTYAIRQQAIPPLLAFNPENPNSLKERSIAAGLVEQRYGVSASPISDEEAQSLSDQLTKAPADRQVQILRSLKSGLDDRYIKAVAGQLAKKKNDPVLAQVMGLSVEAPEAASRVLRGREILRDNKEVMPKGADLKTAQDRIASTLSEAYRHNPEHYSAVSDAAMAIYAYKSWQNKDLSGVIDTSRLDESVKEATGGVLTLGSFGSRYTVQPPKYGMNESDFMDLLKRADYSAAKGMKAEDIQKQGVFESVGDGRYLVKIGPGYVQGKNGVFILDLGSIPSRAAVGARLGGAAGLVR